LSVVGAKIEEQKSSEELIRELKRKQDEVLYLEKRIERLRVKNPEPMIA
jgi:predicted nuclease with TOPRIM domain